MSDLERAKIARGSKLYTENTAGVLNDIKTRLSGAVDKEQVDKNMGSFWIGPLTIPAITSTFGWREGGSETRQNGYLIPFIVPPLRDEFEQASGNPVYKGGTSKVILDAVSFGYDNRDSRAAISDHRNSAAVGDINYTDSGKMNFDSGDAGAHPYDLSIVIYQKDQYFFQDSELKGNRGVYPKDDAYSLGKEIWRADLFGSSVAQTLKKPNPELYSDINVELDRYSTYTIAIVCKNLGNPASAGFYKSFALVGATVGIRCLHPLVASDSFSGTTFGLLGVQNAPREKTGSTLSLSTASPAAGDVIRADENTHGISKLMGDIDVVAQAGITGGSTKEGEKLYNRSLVQDSCYEVIAVPLMQNRARGGIGSYTYGGAISDVLSEPYVHQNPVITTDAAGNRIEDVRVIPIHYPFVIHHVFLAWSWERFLQETGTSFSDVYEFVPQSPTMQVKVGVAIAEGIGSDSIGYQQVASHTLVEPIEAGGSGEPDPSLWDHGLVDRIQAMDLKSGPSRNPNATTPGSSADISLWAHEIHQMTVNKNTGRPPREYEVGTYYPQGEPFFVSRGWTGTGDFESNSTSPYGNNRQPVNAGATSAQPVTRGRESFIEVRMQITDTGASLSTYGNLQDEREIVSGYGGHWVYIIGKKQLVGDF